MARLVDNYQSDERVLMEIASHGLLTNIQQLVTNNLDCDLHCIGYNTITITIENLESAFVISCCNEYFTCLNL